MESGAAVNASACHYSEHYVEISCYCVAKAKKRLELADYLLAQGATVDVFTVAYLGDTAAVRDLLDADPTLLEGTQAQHDSQRSEGETACLRPHAQLLGHAACLCAQRW